MESEVEPRRDSTAPKIDAMFQNVFELHITDTAEVRLSLTAKRLINKKIRSKIHLLKLRNATIVNQPSKILVYKNENAKNIHEMKTTFTLRNITSYQKQGNNHNCHHYECKQPSLLNNFNRKLCVGTKFLSLHKI